MDRSNLDGFESGGYSMNLIKTSAKPYFIVRPGEKFINSEVVDYVRKTLFNNNHPR